MRFRERASHGLSLCFSLCESLVDALADAEDALADATQPDDDLQPVHTADDKERALLQVLRNVDDVAGLVLQFVEQEGGDADVVLAGIRVLGRYDLRGFGVVPEGVTYRPKHTASSYVTAQVPGRMPRCT